ncbi:exopolysaccharide biosynthesis polyprenyl glycosylphosphotransferase [Streptomyces sp. RFCAC02]|uniref:exopolysaccharide biosynthesis polyprenyl glycosylphosphotransferase n=1 Tax=Streptomyces sp. RFCAC02 TaxID=2499143 RepID=UPI001020BC77|nr:exopolysaccharide biosynthesis polyprenyl glycosylphosphotransferase [Streptomyces sp. RFCAC02]
MTIEGTAGRAGTTGRPGTRGPAVVPPRGPLSAPMAPRIRPGGGRLRDAAHGPLLADVLAVAVTAAVWTGAQTHRLQAAVAAAAVLMLLNATRGLYRPAPTDGALDELPMLSAHSAVAWCVADAVLDAAGSFLHLLAAVIGQALTACALRAVAHAVRRGAARSRPRSTLVIGTGPLAQRLAAGLARHPEYGMRPVGLVGRAPRRSHGAAPLPVLCAPGDIERAVVQNTVRDAVFTVPPRPELLRLLHGRGCTAWHVCGEAGARSAGNLLGHPCRRVEPPRTPGARRPVKRGLDIAVAAVALVAAAPLLLACALAVRVSDGPGVLFRQVRVGEGGRRFVLLKFRTLRPADDREAATRWSIEGDPRVSAVGRLLRRSSLDELPQLWNVLRGDMSLVGPRPERPYFVERFSRAHPGYADRHRMPAGLTGLAQISGLRGAAASIEERVRFDNLYIDTWSLWQDVLIMLRTTAVCLRFGGGR